MPREALWVPPQDRSKVYVSIAALAGALVLAGAALAVFLAFVSPIPSNVGPLAHVYVGSVNQFEVGKPVLYAPGKFYVVKQEDGSIIALYPKDPHLGCDVPWREDFVWPDPHDGADKAGWFRDVCYGSTYNAYGVRVFGPSPRNLDRFPVVVEHGQVYVRALKQLLIRGDRGLGAR